MFFGYIRADPKFRVESMVGSKVNACRGWKLGFTSGDQLHRPFKVCRYIAVIYCGQEGCECGLLRAAGPQSVV